MIGNLSSAAYEQVHVGRLRIRTSGADPLTARLRLTRALNTLSLQPSSFNPAAILCIRKLIAPGLGDAPALSAWERSVAQAIDQLARQAARPIAGPVPANAEAVVFADRSEWLACLARDWLAGDAIAHWWWASLFRSSDVARAVITAWLDSPEYIPAALQHLAVERQVIAFVLALQEDELKRMLGMICYTFGLPELQSIFDGELISQRSTPPHEATRIPETTAERLGAEAPISNRPREAPWTHWVTETQDDRLDNPQTWLLGIGLMLHRAPGHIRTASFVRDALAWQRDVQAAPHRVATSPGELKRAADPLPPMKPIGAAQVVAESISVLPDRGLATTRATLDKQPASGVEANAVDHADPIAPVLIVPTFDTPIDSGVQHTQHPPVEMIETTPDAIDEPAALSASVATEIDTDFGGVFYLINLGLYLNLYGDFTQPLRPGLALSIWDFVALVGQQLLGEPLTRDPVWALLAQLAGRAVAEAPGTDFDSPEVDRLPVELRPIFSDLGDPIDLALWMDRLMSFIRSRLAQALGLNETQNAAPFFTQAAHISVTAARLDVSMNLIDLPIEIRLAGLDRDPGWVPAAGRFVAFHFEV